MSLAEDIIAYQTDVARNIFGTSRTSQLKFGQKFLTGVDRDRVAGESAWLQL